MLGVALVVFLGSCVSGVALGFPGTKHVLSNYPHRCHLSEVESHHRACICIAREGAEKGKLCGSFFLGVG